MKIRIKMCGFTNKQDVFEACKLGVDAVGLVCVEESKRCVDEDEAKDIFDSLPVYVSRNLVVFVDSFSQIKEYVKTGCDCLQVHGQLSLDILKKVRREFPSLSIVKSIAVEDTSLKKTVEFSRYVSAFHLDSVDKQGMGGSGETHDWGLSSAMVSALDRPVVLGGGLCPENVSEAILRVNPYAVDVCSGIEESYGKKDYAKMKSFIKEVRR